MPQYYAAVNCPACGARFQTPVEQILDVRVDPQAKSRIRSSNNYECCMNYDDRTLIAKQGSGNKALLVKATMRRQLLNSLKPNFA